MMYHHDTIITIIMTVTNSYAAQIYTIMCACTNYQTPPSANTPATAAYRVDDHHMGWVCHAEERFYSLQGVVVPVIQLRRFPSRGIGQLNPMTGQRAGAKGVLPTGALADGVCV